MAKPDEIRKMEKIAWELRAGVVRMIGVGKAGHLGGSCSPALRLAKRSSRVYVIMGDGEMAEGQLWEAAMAAARYGLDSITGILDRNRIQATGPTKEIFDIPNLPEKWRAFGWNVLGADGHDVGAVLDALDEAAAKKGAPSVIVAAFHNAAPTREQYDTALREIEESGRRLQRRRQTCEARMGPASCGCGNRTRAWWPGTTIRSAPARIAASGEERIVKREDRAANSRPVAVQLRVG